MGIRPSEHLTLGQIYSRKQLGERFAITDATIRTGIFRPADHDSVWLFVTRDKTPDRTQYVDRLEGNELYFEGQTKGRTDDLIREHRERGLELLLFFRERRDEHADYGFRYEGLFEHVEDTPGTPTRFHLRRVQAANLKAAVLKVAESPSQLQQNVRRFCQGTALYPARARAICSQTQYWVYDVDSVIFGPAKFVGFDVMTFDKYEAANQGRSIGARFDGHVTRMAIEAILGPFGESQELRERLTKQLGPEVCATLDTGKWRCVRLPSTFGYYALLCNPDRFDGLGVVAALPEIAWTVNRMNPQVGDRVILWQAKGRGDHRGVIAIGEVTRGVLNEPCPEAEAGFWREEDNGSQPRIRFKTYEAPGLPLWEHEAHEWLGQLAVARATGGTVFSLDPDEWARIAELAAVESVGGDHEEPRAASGQGVGLSAPERRAIELHAQTLAEEYFVDFGFTVVDVSRNLPFDLLCTRGNEELHVEVKGTTGLGEEVVLTKNEVAHARENAGKMVLAVVSRIRLERMPGGPQVTGGKLTVWQPWAIDDGEMLPTQFRYTPP